MDVHNLKDKALNSIQHSNIPPTTEEVLNAWNRGSHPGQGSVLLSEDAGRRLIRAQEQLSGPGSNVAAAEGYLRGDRYTSGQRSNECEDIAVEPLPPFGAWAYVGIVICILSACLVGWGAGYLFEAILSWIGGAR